MATFLSLCQDVAAESGTTGFAATPSSVLNQTGRLRLIVRWVNDAWRDVQMRRGDWLWMVGEAEVTPASASGVYTAADLSLSRLADWRTTKGPTDDSGWTVQLASDAADPESFLRYVPWRTFRNAYLRRPIPATDRPQIMTVDPQNRLRLGPAPDAVYILRGEYRKTPQTLAANDDTPEMPEQHHRLIVERALDYLGIYDEATAQVPAWSGRAQARLNDLIRDQTPLPSLHYLGPLA